MRKQSSVRLYEIVVVVAFLFVISSAAGAANLRGRVDFQSPSLSFATPRPNALVELYPSSWAGDYTPFSTNTSGDGMFYFQNVPPGTYDCWVERAFHYRIAVGPGPTQDVAPLLVRSIHSAVLKGLVVGIVEGDFIIIRSADNSNFFVRLSGIYAPKTPQPLAEQSRDHLATLTSGTTVSVAYEKSDHLGRIVGKVLLNGQDICLEQLKAGMAWYYRVYEQEQTEEERSVYAPAEDGARKAKLGVWANELKMPEEPRSKAATYTGQGLTAEAITKYVGERGESFNYLSQNFVAPSNAKGVLKSSDGNTTADVTSKDKPNGISIQELFNDARRACEKPGFPCRSNVGPGEPYCIQKGNYFVVTCNKPGEGFYTRTALSPRGQRLYTLTVRSSVIDKPSGLFPNSFRPGMD